MIKKFIIKSDQKIGERCDWAALNIDDDRNWCHVAGIDIDDNHCNGHLDDRPEWCPLIEVDDDDKITREQIEDVINSVLKKVIKR